MTNKTILEAQEVAEVCPECGGEIHVSHHEATFATPECCVKRCLECEWEGDPE